MRHVELKSGLLAPGPGWGSEAVQGPRAEQPKPVLSCSFGLRGLSIYSGLRFPEPRYLLLEKNWTHISHLPRLLGGLNNTI